MPKARLLAPNKGKRVREKGVNKKGVGPFSVGMSSIPIWFELQKYIFSFAHQA